MVPVRDIFEALRSAAQHHHASPYSFPADWDADAWTCFEQQARHHGCLPLLAHHLQAGRLLNLPAQRTAVFLKSLHACRLAHQCALQEAQAIVRAFDASGIPAVLLKGPHLAEAAYTSAGLRPFEDLDLLIEATDRHLAERVLLEAGYRPPPDTAPRWLIHRYHFHTQWRHPGKRFLVELHWRPADRRRLPDRDAPSSYVADLQSDPAAMAIYLAIHLAKHSLLHEHEWARAKNPLHILHPWSGIRWIWILDFEGLCLTRNLTPDNLDEAAERWQARNALRLVRLIIALSQTQPTRTRSPLASSRSSWLIRRMVKDLNNREQLPSMPWCLRPHPATGFRPIRLLDLFRK